MLAAGVASSSDSAVRPLRVSLLSPRASGTGNRATADRIAHHLNHPPADLRVDTYDAADEASRRALERAVDDHKVDVLVGLHAFRSGQYLLPLARPGLPIVIICGGTDVNEMLALPHERDVIARLLCREAAAVVCFTHAMEARVKQLWQEESLAQTLDMAVALPPLPPLQLPPLQGACPCDQSFCARQKFGIAASDFIFLLPCTLRTVKDPFFLADAFERWHATRSDVHLLIVGSLVDEAYQSLALRYADARPPSVNVPSSAVSSPPPPYTGVIWCDYLSDCSELFPSLVCASAMVNSSVCEGQSGAILEAMKLRVPVLARCNEGNESIIRHQETGLLFRTPKEFIELTSRVCDEWLPMSLHASSRTVSTQHPSSVSNMVSSALAYVDSAHGVSTESAAYATLLREVTRDHGR